MAHEKTTDVQFNNCIQAIEKGGLKKKFSILAHGEDFVKKSLGKKKWKDYKCEIRCTYMTRYKIRDALIKSRRTCIPRDQWTSLVSYWLSDKGKVTTLEETNT
uniref:Uncharacterized protein n=1 Tax=Cajanus cajan TaxID=3821 RepID=A0A151QS75_CAJCA|nr:hypothetical protein KK1_046003 [Cajanus cajan]KYP33162.1 hypothetical protein KK1_046005 [Cajanus cajan]